MLAKTQRPLGAPAPPRITKKNITRVLATTLASRAHFFVLILGGAGAPRGRRVLANIRRTLGPKGGLLVWTNIFSLAQKKRVVARSNANFLGDGVTTRAQMIRFANYHLARPRRACVLGIFIKGVCLQAPVEGLSLKHPQVGDARKVLFCSSAFEVVLFEHA